MPKVLSSLVSFAMALGVSAASCELLPMPRGISWDAGEFAMPGRDASCLTGVVSVVRDASVPAEGYRIDVTAAGVSIASSDDAGRFYAHGVVASLACADGRGKVTVPCCRIVDSPVFAWRGVLLDECRHFFGKTAVKEILDLMALHRLNVLHWHLTDADAWRLEIPGFPELIEYGAVRPSGVAPDWTGGNKRHTNERYGPYFYTADDVREILAYAAERQISVVPEIEMPAHARAALAAYPEFSCRGAALRPRIPHCTIGPQYEIFCAGNEEAMVFLEKVLDYVCALFPSKVIGIGGDECPKNRWKECPKCQARIRALGLEGEEQLQNWMTHRFCGFLAKRGRRALAWDEALNGAMPTNLTVQVWHEPKNAVCAAKAGCDVVMSPSKWCYFDFSQGVEDDPHNYFGHGLSARRAAEFDPYAGFPEELRSRVTGVECCNWSELTWNRDDLAWKMWPRVCIFSEIAWGGPRTPDEDFWRRLSVRRKELIKRGVNCAPIMR